MAVKGEGLERVHRVERRMIYSVYILRDSCSNLYIGQTNNLDKRLREHRQKLTKASKFTKDNGVFKLVYQERYLTRLESMRREKQLKSWTRAKKEALILGDLKLLKSL